MENHVLLQRVMNPKFRNYFDENKNFTFNFCTSFKIFTIHMKKSGGGGALKVRLSWGRENWTGPLLVGELFGAMRFPFLAHVS